MTKEDEVKEKQNDPTAEASGRPAEGEVAAPGEIKPEPQIKVGTEAKTPEPGEENVFSQYMDRLKQISKGNLVSGKIVKVDDTDVFVDVGYKTEGRVRRSEFGDAEIKVGENVDVVVLSVEGGDGNLILSKEKADTKKLWDNLFSAYRNKKIIKAKVTSKVKGGLKAEYMGLSCFVPASHISTRRRVKLDDYLGKEYEFMVFEVNKKRNNVVLSRKAAMEKRRAELVDNIFSELRVGELVKGVVKKITDFGVFVDIGGIDGLLHIKDMSWSHISTPASMVEVGQEIEVKVLSADRETEKISLGLKQKSEDPWLSAAERYIPGMIFDGRVKKIMNYGAFVEIEEGIEGLVHISDLVWRGRVNHPSDILKENDRVLVRVLALDAEKRKISLGMKQVRPDPWITVDKNYSVGSVVKGVVKNLTKYGAFVELEEGLEGLLHISDLSWSSRVRHPSQVLSKGDVIEVKVLALDKDNRKISLGLKQVFPDPWTVIHDKYKIGKVYQGKVKNVVDFGVFIELEEDVEGLLHVSDLSWSTRYPDPHTMFKPGDVVEVKVIGLNVAEKRVSLGLKQLRADPWLDIEKRYKIGETYPAVVQSLGKSGAFVRLEEGVEGFIHASDIFWDGAVTDINKVMKVGEHIQVKILNLDNEKRKVSLTLKHPYLDPWEKYSEKLVSGTVLEGEVTKITTFGVFVQIVPGVEGLVHVSQISDAPFEKVEDVLAVGDKVKVKIIEVNKDNRRLKLSIKDAIGLEVTGDLESEQKEGRTVIGDLFGDMFLEKFKDLK